MKNSVIATLCSASIGFLASPLSLNAGEQKMRQIAFTATVKTGFEDAQLRRITETGAEFVDWQGGDSFIYNFGNKIYRYRIGQGKPRLLHTIRLTMPRKEGAGVTVFKNGRIITLSGESGAGQVIESGALVVKDRRIVSVGPADSVATPSGARVIDATGLTLMPGLGDMHYHSSVLS